MTGETAVSRLPFDAEVFEPENLQSDLTVVFVHHFGGSKATLRRHIQFFNALGFRAVGFSMTSRFRVYFGELPVSSEFEFGLKHVYAEQINSVLNAIPGRKIIYAFSNPCGSAIEAVASRHGTDVAALICDSGPTANVWRSTLSYVNKENSIPLLPLRAAFSALYSFTWSPQVNQEIAKDLASLPEGFKILSVRGWKDTIIPPASIDPVFRPHSNLDWRKLGLPEAGHLDGLKNHKDDYAAGVMQFLKQL